MAIGTFGSFTQARLAIYAAQTGLSITGNNISNINTAGYTRQRLEQDSLHVGGTDRYANKNDIRTGQGVLCTGVSQLRDPYLDIRYRSATSETGYLDAKLGGLETLAHYIDEVGKGEQTEGEDFGILGAKIMDLVKGLSQVTDQTNHAEFDRQVRSYAENVVSVIHRYASALNEAYDNAVKAYNKDVEHVNGILQGIRDLNEEIRRCEIYSDPALELRDHRNNLIDELSEYVKINTRYTTEEIAPGLEVEKLIITLGDANKDASIESDETKLIDGIYGGQLLQATPMMSTAYDENYNVPANDPTYDPAKANKYMIWTQDADGKFLTNPDGTPQVTYTNDIREATMLEGENNPNFGLSVSELRNKRGELLYTMTSPETTTMTEAEYNAAVAHGTSSEVVDPVTGDKKVTTYNRVVDKKTGNVSYYQMEYNLIASQKVGLMDNDIYGALQAERELLTEDGEFTDTVVYDENGNPEDPLYTDAEAKHKRGIPYYQKSLDMLANKLAEVMNDMNQGCLYDKDGNYIQYVIDPATGKPAVDKETGFLKGEPVTIKDATNNVDVKLTTKTKWEDLPADVQTALTDATGLTYNKDSKVSDPSEYVGTDKTPLEVNNPQKIIEAYLRGTKYVEAGGNLADGTTATKVTAEAGTAIGIVAKGEGPLFSNNGNGDDTTEINAENISISNSWASNGVQLIKQFEVPPGYGEPVSGASDNILHMAYVLQYQKLDYIPKDFYQTPDATGDVMFNGTFNEMWENMGSVLANDQSITTTNLTSAYESATSIDTQRDSVSAVDFNDEAMNLMMYSKSYNAACRLMTTIDTVLDKLINNTGVTT